MSDDPPNKLGEIMEIIDKLEGLLDEEMEAIQTGYISKVIEITSEKNALVTQIDESQEYISSSLKKNEKVELKEILESLFTKLERNKHGLESMISAVQDIASEFQRIEERKRDNGLYGRKGKKMKSLTKEEGEIDGKI